MAEQSSQNWWQTLPGILTALGGVVSAITALVVALHQTGVLDREENDKPVAVAKTGTDSPSVDAAKNPAGDGMADSANKTLERTPTAAGHIQRVEARDSDTADDVKNSTHDLRTVLKALKTANIDTSVGDTKLLDWLNDDDRTYRRIADVSLELLDGRRMPGQGPDIDVIKYHYLEFTHRDGGGLIPLGERLDRNAMRRALLTASNDKNGGHVQRFERLFGGR